VLMGLQETKEPGALGEAGEQRPIVARQPAIEGTIPATFERMQQPQRDHLAGPEVGLGMFGDGAQLLIDLVEQRCDEIHRDHPARLFRGRMSRRPAWRRCRTTASPKMYTSSFTVLYLFSSL